MTTPLPLEPIEKASRDELAALQLDRLKWSLKHAYQNSPVYRRKFDEAGVHPDDLKSLADLARFLERRASRRSSATRQKTSIPGPTSSPARSARPAPGAATRCT
jgi:hypothetical protein